MASEPDNTDPIVSEEDMVAYLDGELDDQASRRIEELLVANPKVRETLQQLEHTWDLLDELGQGEVDETFTRSTLEMVVQAAAEDARQEQTAVARPLRRWLLVAGAIVAAGLAGFLATALLWPDPQRQLLQDLPLLENLDQYRQIDNFEFLERLRSEGLFSEEVADEF
jgi:anti-sigma factor RsiW